MWQVAPGEIVLTAKTDAGDVVLSAGAARIAS
jgi:hypothetical protein